MVGRATPVHGIPQFKEGRAFHQSEPYGTCMKKRVLQRLAYEGTFYVNKSHLNLHHHMTYYNPQVPDDIFLKCFSNVKCQYFGIMLIKKNT